VQREGFGANTSEGSAVWEGSLAIFPREFKNLTPWEKREFEKKCLQGMEVC